MTATSAPPPGNTAGGRTPSIPSWLEEVLEVVDERRSLVITTAAAISLLGIASAFLLPQFVPPRPLVGAAVGLAAALLSTAVALAVDSLDLTVRGGRHVRAAGGRHLVTLPGPPAPDTAEPLARALAERLREQEQLRVALVPVSRSITTTPAWTEALATAVAALGHRVLLVNLADGPDHGGRVGVLEVVREGLRLSASVRFEPDLPLARLGAGASDDAALEALPHLVTRLPRDVEVLLVALPPLQRPGVLTALSALQRVALVARIGVTPRVDLVAALDAIDGSFVATDVALLDPEADAPFATVEEDDDRPLLGDLAARPVPPSPTAWNGDGAADEQSTSALAAELERSLGLARDDAPEEPAADVTPPVADVVDVPAPWDRDPIGAGDADAATPDEERPAAHVDAVEDATTTPGDGAPAPIEPAAAPEAEDATAPRDPEADEPAADVAAADRSASLLDLAEPEGPEPTADVEDLDAPEPVTDLAVADRPEPIADVEDLDPAEPVADLADADRPEPLANGTAGGAPTVASGDAPSASSDTDADDPETDTQPIDLRDDDAGHDGRGHDGRDHDGRSDDPVVLHEDPDDPVRITAAIHTLAIETWAEEDRGD